MSASPYERNEFFQSGQPLRPSEVRNTVRKLSSESGYQSYGGGQWSGDQYYDENLGYDWESQRRSYGGGYGSGYGGGYGGGYQREQYVERQPYYGRQQYLQRPSYSRYGYGGGGGGQWLGGGEQFQQYRRAPLFRGRSSYYPTEERYIGRSYLPEVTHLHKPEVIREVIEEEKPVIREVVHVQHRPITVKDVYLKEPTPQLPPLEKRRFIAPELTREVVHEVKPVIREVVHHERRPVIVREKFAVERQPEVRHFSETLMHKHMPGENIVCETVPSSSGYETVGELYGQPMTSSSISQPISSQ